MQCVQKASMDMVVLNAAAVLTMLPVTHSQVFVAVPLDGWETNVMSVCTNTQAFLIHVYTCCSIKT